MIKRLIDRLLRKYEIRQHVYIYFGPSRWGYYISLSEGMLNQAHSGLANLIHVQMYWRLFSKPRLEVDVLFAGGSRWWGIDTWQTKHRSWKSTRVPRKDDRSQPTIPT